MHRLAAATCAVLFSGCFFPADRGRVVESRLDGLIADTRKEKSDLADTRSKLEEASTQLQTALDQLDRATRTTGANIGVKMDAALQDIAVLRGQIETQQQQIQALETKLAAQAAAAAAVAAVNNTPSEPPQEELKRPDDPKEFLKLADEKAKAGDLEFARRLYAEFLKKFPRDEGVGEAHFALGELFFGEQKCREALYEYGRVIEAFAKTKSTPLAYLRSSDCFNQLKMNDASRLSLEELVKTFPRSDAAKTAKTKLAELRKMPKK